MEPLVIIDMQSVFIRRDHYNQLYPLVIDNVIKEIAAAFSRNDPIIFVEFCTHTRDIEQRIWDHKPSLRSPSLGELIALTEDYENRFFVFKSQCSGGFELSTLFKEQNITYDAIRVCGVFTNACVYETVRSMTMRFFPSAKIKVVQNAMATASESLQANIEAVLELTQLNPNISVFGPEIW